MLQVASPNYSSHHHTLPNHYHHNHYYHNNDRSNNNSSSYLCKPWVLPKALHHETKPSDYFMLHCEWNVQLCYMLSCANNNAAHNNNHITNNDDDNDNDNVDNGNNDNRASHMRSGFMSSTNGGYCKQVLCCVPGWYSESMQSQTMLPHAYHHSCPNHCDNSNTCTNNNHSLPNYYSNSNHSAIHL